MGREAVALWKNMYWHPSSGVNGKNAGFVDKLHRPHPFLGEMSNFGARQVAVVHPYRSNQLPGSEVLLCPAMSVQTAGTIVARYSVYGVSFIGYASIIHSHTPVVYSVKVVSYLGFYI